MLFHETQCETIRRNFKSLGTMLFHGTQYETITHNISKDTKTITAWCEILSSRIKNITESFQIQPLDFGFLTDFLEYWIIKRMSWQWMCMF